MGPLAQIVFSMGYRSKCAKWRLTPIFRISPKFFSRWNAWQNPFPACCRLFAVDAFSKEAKGRERKRRQTQLCAFVCTVFAPWFKAYYPNVTESDLELLYGKDLANLRTSRHTSLDLAKFFEITRPKYYIVHCWLSQDIDCRDLWQLIWTLRGACLGNDVIIYCIRMSILFGSMHYEINVF